MTGGSIRHLRTQGRQGFTKNQAIGGMIVDNEGSDALKIEWDLVLYRCRIGLYRELHAAMKRTALSESTLHPDSSIHELGYLL